MNILKKISMILMGLLFSTGVIAKEKVVFWHSMSGGLEKTLDKIVGDYNNSQEKIEVEAIYQGSYEEAIAKFKAVSGTTEAPAIVQMNDVSTAFMYRSGSITPIQNFIEKENFDQSKLEEPLLNYYRVNNRLYSMPFNSSTAILVYNKDAFKEAGLNPEKPPKSYDEFVEYSEKLTKKNKNGTIDRYGFSMIMYGWFIEQLLANQNGLYVDEKNGRNGNLPTQVVYDKNLEPVFSWLQNMYKKNIATSYGRDWDSTRTAFTSGKVAMFLDSSAGIKGIIKNSNFEVGTSFIPNESGEFYGSLIGGASLWITNSVNDENQNAAWDFIKYAVSKDVQTYWAANTGYYPVNKESDDGGAMKATTLSYTTQGAILGSFPEVREKMVQAMERNYEGKESVVEILRNVSEESNKIIKRFNRVNK
ncbi:MAG: ABC transporter substrate-binding protein [Cetobacterium sp.]|uniref:ABC transporter substrate-binding protein n=1 Tax=Cetobacterium sp. TaxID=2071632 RepID=UPI002FC73E64